mmetsp:Transcript_24959/g.78670  ORF Transcript_24959/g.78670 Transcript_24959/m.78670 type:complete len:333 (-) Transcript_24959:90-1088(-)
MQKQTSGLSASPASRWLSASRPTTTSRPRARCLSSAPSRPRASATLSPSPGTLWTSSKSASPWTPQSGLQPRASCSSPFCSAAWASRCPRRPWRQAWALGSRRPRPRAPGRRSSAALPRPPQAARTPGTSGGLQAACSCNRRACPRWTHRRPRWTPLRGQRPHHPRSSAGGRPRVRRGPLRRRCSPLVRPRRPRRQRLTAWSLSGARGNGSTGRCRCLQSRTRQTAPALLTGRLVSMCGTPTRRAWRRARAWRRSPRPAPVAPAAAPRTSCRSWASSGALSQRAHNSLWPVDEVPAGGLEVEAATCPDSRKASSVGCHGAIHRPARSSLVLE